VSLVACRLFRIDPVSGALRRSSTPEFRRARDPGASSKEKFVDRHAR
jgi:hypothetical protein